MFLICIPQTLEDSQKIKQSKRQRNNTLYPLRTTETPVLGNTEYFLHYKDKLNESVFEGPLTPLNYKERFHHLLCWEEKEHMCILSNRYVSSTFVWKQLYPVHVHIIVSVHILYGTYNSFLQNIEGCLTSIIKYSSTLYQSVGRRSM